MDDRACPGKLLGDKVERHVPRTRGKNDQKTSASWRKGDALEVCTHHLGGLTSHREQENNKIASNEFTSAAAETEAHSITVRRAVGSTKEGHVVRSCVASCRHQSTHVKRIDMHNKIR